MPLRIVSRKAHSPTRTKSAVRGRLRPAAPPTSANPANQSEKVLRIPHPHIESVVPRIDMHTADLIAIAWLITFSGVTFLVFAWDKWRARRGGQRVSERMLAGLGAAGGWPGGLLAMILFRHKTAKPAFLAKYGFALVLFAVLLLGWLWSNGHLSP